jgi:tRNA(Ile)-lysidine synthase
LRADERVVVAFSGGPDSTALLIALHGFLDAHRILAAHLDHGLDPQSEARAHAAGLFARSLGVAYCASRIEVRRAGGESLEAVARTVRYEFLEQTRRRHQARFIATAHHADDQLETLVLRLLQGSGWQGLAGISEQHGATLRPFLGLHRHQLRQALSALDASWSQDPTNLEPSCARNRLRLGLLPVLERLEPDLPKVASRLSEAATAARYALARRLTAVLRLRSEPDGASLELAALRSLHPALVQAALDLLHRAASRPYPPSAARRRELVRQLARNKRVGCDCGAGWRWLVFDDRLHLRHATGSVSYTR